MYIASIDPGAVSGRIVISEIVESQFFPRQMIKMPVTTFQAEIRKTNKNTGQKYKTTKNKNVVNSYKLAQYISKISEITNVVTLEDYSIQAFSKTHKNVKFTERNPANEAITFSNWGKIQAVLEIYRMTVIKAAAISWKSKLGLKGCDKQSSIHKCIEFFGADITHCVLKKEHNACDAALIGYYAYKYTTGIHTLLRKEAN